MTQVDQLDLQRSRAVPEKVCRFEVAMAVARAMEGGDPFDRTPDDSLEKIGIDRLW